MDIQLALLRVCFIIFVFGLLAFIPPRPFVGAELRKRGSVERFLGDIGDTMDYWLYRYIFTNILLLLRKELDFA
jgi:hypothetical protein